MAFETGLLLALGAMLCWGIGDFLIQKSVRKVGDTETLAFIGVVGAVGLLPLITSEFYKLTAANVLFLAGIGAVTFVAAMLDFEALKQGKLSVVEVMLEIELPVTVMLGVFFLGETLTPSQLAIISFVFFGILLIASEHLSLKHFRKGLEKGALIAVGSAIAMGMVNFLTGLGSKGVSPLLVIWVPWVVFTVLCLGYLWKRNALKDFAANAKKHSLLVGATGFFDTLAWLLFALAVAGNQISVTIGVTESYPAVAMLLAFWVNKEQVKPHQAIGGIVAVGASVALATLL